MLALLPTFDARLVDATTRDAWVILHIDAELPHVKFSIYYVVKTLVGAWT